MTVNWEAAIAVVEAAGAIGGLGWFLLNRYVKMRMRDHDQDAAIERANQEIGKLAERVARASGSLDTAFQKIRALEGAKRAEDPE
jgi:hypothetical protein